MAKESMKAREVKRAKLVARYADHRGSRRSLRGCSQAAGYPQERQPHPSAQPLQDHGSSQGIHPPVWSLSYSVP